ncbi:hypothetical protein [Amycolatopsis cihanbeyliensis]|uniref:hypothetical protein n=1 Tax=Amycolatopsis cihanbeyliensis TaxID=1128664 RepID=UPI001153AD17|nr:hypothetical protein [Amycolatopsis cihanbeyliensis]
MPLAVHVLGLGIFGLGALLGITLGGRVADDHPLRTLLGFAGFVTNPALNTRGFSLAEGAPTLAGPPTSRPSTSASSPPPGWAASPSTPAWATSASPG